MKSNQLMELFGVSDIMDLPDAIMEVLLGDIDRRNDVYTRLLEMNGMDVSYDWFQEMYESELAERSQKAQLFTPPGLSKLLAGLTGAPHGDYYDPLISICTLRVSIDIVKLDERLHQEWGPYEEKGQSMKDCILEHYGRDAVALIEKMS